MFACFLVYSYNNWRAYGQSKLANILHANELTKHLKVCWLLLYRGVIYKLSSEIVNSVFLYHNTLFFLAIERHYKLQLLSLVYLKIWPINKKQMSFILFVLLTVPLAFISWLWNLIFLIKHYQTVAWLFQSIIRASFSLGSPGWTILVDFLKYYSIYRLADLY